MTAAEVRALGTITDLPTACSALGMSRAAGYRLAKAGKFPCPVIELDQRYARYKVPVAGLLAVLGIDG